MIYKRYTAHKKATIGIQIIVFIIMAVLCTPKASGKNRTFWKSIETHADTIVNLIENEENASTGDLIERLYLIADSINNDDLKARAIFFNIYTNRPSDLTAMLTQTDKAIALADSIHYPYDYHRLLALKSNILINMGNYIEAFKLLSLTTPYFTTIGDSAQTAIANGNTGLVYLLIEEYDEAFHYLQRAQQLFKQNENLHSYLLSCQQIAYIYEKTGKIDKALELLRSIIDKYRDAPADVQEMRYYCIASYFKLLDNKDEQEKWLDELYDTALKTGNWQCRVNAIKNKAAWLFDQNQLDSALVYADSAYHYAQTNLLTFGQEGDIYKLLSQIHGSRHEWEEAYHFRIRAEEYQDSVRLLDMRTDIQKEKIRQEIAQNAMQMHELEMEKRQSIIVGTIVAIALLLLLILSGIIIYLLRKRAQERKLLYESKEKELTGQVEAKSRELSSDKLLSVSQIKTLEALSGYIRQMQEEKQIDRQVASVILGKIQESFKKEDEWENFKKHFDEVHPSFFKKLKELHPSLTENERKLCAYYKMGISNKQVALMMSVQPKSVIISRYRMHKKMGLSKEVSLNDYLATL